MRPQESSLHDCISFIVVVRNDLKGFDATWKSIFPQLINNDEVVIVDGSDNADIVEYLKLYGVKNASIKYLTDNKNGVFKAQNLGLNNATKDWVCVINSGDQLKEFGRRLFQAKLAKSYYVDCHVFSQDSIDNNNKIVASFMPSAMTLWPHQSIIIKRSIHLEYGYYDEGFKYSGEQFFFSKIRKKITYKIHPEALTTYLLGGLSDEVNLQHSKEQFLVRRQMGNGIIYSFYLAYISPMARIFIRKILGDDCVNMIRKMIYSHYR